MHPLQLRERVQRVARQNTQDQREASSPLKPMRMETVMPRKMPAGQSVRVHKVEENLQQQRDGRVQHELAEMQQTHDLREVDDDVEDIATLYEWQAEEHTHRPKNSTWFAMFAAAITIVVGTLVFLGNFMGAVTMAFVGGLTYYVAQKKPAIFRYRILVDGIAINNFLYHFRDLAVFNIVYEPGVVKTVLLRSKRTLAPMIHMEIGEADPVAMRDILLEFLPEDQEMTEPIVDIWARRLGF
ncbi:MAG: HXXEE domain-containing protein [Candidatus Andersenbacteria bacterium]|nr:HXXEE domain-containing protein [Candidatus Andersenbacteria bacterium]